MKKTNRIMSMLLAIIMVVCMLPIGTITAVAREARSGEVTVGSVFFYEGLWYECVEMLNAGRTTYYLQVAAPEDNTVYSGFYRIPSAFPYSGAHCIVVGIGSHTFANSDVSGVHMEQTWRYYTIGQNAFLNCTRLTEVTFGESFTESDVEGSIGDYAFSGCTALEHIVIPPRIKTIGMYVFKNCTELKTVVYDYPYIENRRVSEYAYDDANPIVSTRYRTPKNPRWEGTAATWDALNTSYVRYEVQFSGTAAGGIDFLTKSFYTTGTSIDISEYSSAPGTYSFTVKAIEPEVVFANLKVDGSDSVNSGILTVGGIEISNVNAVRTGSGTVELTFDSTSDGSLYYWATQLESIDGPSTDGPGIPCTKGSNRIILTEIADEPLRLEIRLKNSNGMRSDLVRLELSEYVVPSVSVGKTTLYDGEYTTDGETKTADTPTDEGYVYFKDGVLTLNNFSYTGEGIEDSNIAIFAGQDLKIQVLGNNTINSKEDNGIVVEGNLEISGGGSLKITTKEDAGWRCTAIRATPGTATVKDVTLVIQSDGYGIYTGDLTMDGVTADIRTNERECLAVNSVTIANSTLRLASEEGTCIMATTDGIEIANSTVTASGDWALSVNYGCYINLISGTYQLSGTLDEGAIYVQDSTLALPEVDYWWRTDASDGFTKSTSQEFTYSGQTYVEITTIDPDAEVQVGQVTLKNGEYTTNGTSKIDGEPTGTGYAHFKNGVLTLNNFTYSGGGDYISAIYCNHALTIKVEGENSITRVVTAADEDTKMALRGIRVEHGKLTIIGDSKDDSLRVVVDGHDDVSASGIYGDTEGIDIYNCTLEARSVNGGRGLNAPGDITITGAKVIGASEAPATSLNNQGIYAGILKVTNSDVIGIADNTSPGRATGIYLDSSKSKLIFEGGTIVGEVPDALGNSHAIYIHKNIATLPTNYWMRTSESASFAEGTWDGANIGPYIELTTTLQSGCITNISEMDKVYDGSAVEAPTVSALSTGGKTFKYKVKGADDSTYTTEPPTNAGEYTCLITVAADDNYTKATATKDFVISKAPLTVTANSHQITYGEEPVGNGVDITGFAPGEDENYLGGELNYDFTYIRYEDIGDNYEIRPKGYDSDNYDFIYVPGTLKVVAADQSAPTTPAGVNTTFINTADGKITGITSEMEYRKDGDANYKAVTGTEITGLAAGTYYVRFAANVNYNASSEIRIVIDLGDKRTPSIDTDPTASRVIIGGKLSNSILTGGVASVDGEFTWVNPDAVMNTAGKFDMLVRFTPIDTATYNTVDFEIEVEVVVCDTASGEHEYTEQMNNADEHWTVCAKCKTEETDSREAHKGGTATCTEKAECTECGEEYGKANGHTYENGKCTVCDATDPNYVPDSPQTGDNSNMALWVALLFISVLGIVVITVLSRKKRAN